ncbi:MAG: glycosyltransferase [Bacteroidota bacterium]
MDISVIIVNYNVKYFLEQCLNSVIRAVKHLNVEVFVVDNNSVDGSNQMILSKFPEVILIANKENVGFSKANNQAIEQAKGKYILLLNPDTVIEEDTLLKCHHFMEEHPKAGSMSVKMIDGKGHFLPESKRSLPTPEVAFYKIFGLSTLFPKSKRFAKYHLGHLDKNKTHEIEILPGAFMFIRKSVLEKVGYLDESFFMYGEDIDLSYRILKGGFINYYYPETTIIHYKGESTKKGSLNYVRTFYNAMIIFARKHFPAGNAKLFSSIINIAIYFRAFLSVLKRILGSMFLPLFDFILIYAGYKLILPWWEDVALGQTAKYPDFYMVVIVPLYILIWLFMIYYLGGYEKPVKILNILKGLTTGTLIILVIYALLPLQYRFSRAMILFGVTWSVLTILSFRVILHVFKVNGYQLALAKRKRIAILGSGKEAKRVQELLKQTNLKFNLVGLIKPEVNGSEEGMLGTIEQLPEIVKVNKIEEIIFCAGNLKSRDIIRNMLRLSGINVDYKIAPEESLSIIGSNSINTAGELYTIDFNLIDKGFNKRNKRVLDVLLSLIFLIFYPVFAFLVKKPARFLKNISRVFFGMASWVGYYSDKETPIQNLPPIKVGILTPLDAIKRKDIPRELSEKLNILYAKDYRIINDLNIIYKGFKHSGR